MFCDLENDQTNQLTRPSNSGIAIAIYIYTHPGREAKFTTLQVCIVTGESSWQLPNLCRAPWKEEPLKRIKV